MLLTFHQTSIGKMLIGTVLVNRYSGGGRILGNALQGPGLKNFCISEKFRTPEEKTILENRRNFKGWDCKACMEYLIEILVSVFGEHCSKQPYWTC